MLVVRQRRECPARLPVLTASQTIFTQPRARVRSPIQLLSLRTPKTTHSE